MTASPIFCEAILRASQGCRDNVLLVNVRKAEEDTVAQTACTTRIFVEKQYWT